MGNLDERLERLEEAMGVNRRSGAQEKRVEEKIILLLYAEVGRGEDKAKPIIDKYGSLDAALEVYSDVNEYSDLDRLTKDEEEELYHLSLHLH